MKYLPKRLLSFFLIVTLLGTFVLQAAPQAQAVDYLTTLPQKHYGEYGTVNMVYDQGNCYSMQGMAVDANYTYCAKIGSNDAVACVVRLAKSDGAKTIMTNTANNSYYFYNLGHANALDIATINGAQQMFVTAGATLVRLTMNGTKLTTAGTYTFSIGGTTTNMTAVQLTYTGAKEVGVIAKSGRSIYTGTLDPTVSSGNIELTHLCTLDVSKIRLKGEIIDYSKFTQQGFDYHDGKLFLPLTGNAYAETINYSIVAVYDLEGASGTVYNDPTLSFRIISGQYAGLFEIEDVEVCNYDGKLYFSSNRRKTASDTNYDGVSFFDGYVYDPAMSTTGPDDYRWETVDDQWVSVMNGGNTLNNPIRVAGAISNNTMSGCIYHMSRSVVLQHDKPWAVEWKSSGSFQGGGMLLQGGKTSSAVNEPYIFRFQNSTFISMGYYDGKQHNNYGVKLSDHGIDGLAEHVYRLYNKINADGYNLVYLSVDGKELGALNNYYIGLSDQNRKEDWVTGKDFTFSYQGTLDNPLNQCKLDYLQVWANGVPADTNNCYRWESKNDNLTSVTGSDYTENVPTIYNGSVSGTTYTSACFRLDKAVRLMHDHEWSIEWQSEGTTSSVFLLSAGEGGKNVGAPYLFRYGVNLFFLGANDGTQHANYGIDISKHGIDGTAKHTYRLANKVASNGSNMVYLYVDGVEVGPMNNVYSGITEKNTTSDWLNGKDLVFDYVGNRSYPMGGNYQYLQINEQKCSHSFTAWQTTAATCTAAGFKSRSCTLCGTTERQELPATGHDYRMTVKDATCTADGAKTYTCVACGDHYEEAIPAIGHSYSSTVIEPTCTNKGYTAHSCTVCKHIYTSDEVAAPGHKYQAEVTTEPTCTVAGVRTYTCSGCGDSYTEPISADGHRYSSTVIAPTCTTKGYTNNICTVCKHSYTSNEVSAPGHSYKAVTVNATCTQNGSVTNTCTACGDTTTEVIPAKGHSYRTTVIAPTCTAGGYTTYTCTTCGHSYQDQITNATGHSYSAGRCVTCGAADPNYNPGVTKPTLTLKSPTLEFKDMITVNAFYTAENIQDVVEMGMVTYNTQVSTVSVDTADHVIPGATYVESSGRYYSCSQGIHAKYLGDTVYLAIYAKLSDGSYAYSKLAGYSAVQYANSQLKNSTDAKLKQLVVAMLNYGAEAQLYFGHNIGSLANAALTAAQKALSEAYRSDMVQSVPAASTAKQGVFANNQGFASRKPAISFEGAFCINYFFTPKYAPDSGITLYYWDAEDYNAASVLTTANATGSFKLEGSGTGEYRGDITSIAAKALSEAVYVAAAYKSGGTIWTSGVLGYSIGSYCSSQASKGGTIAGLAQATAVYGYHAKQYFG